MILDKRGRKAGNRETRRRETDVEYSWLVGSAAVLGRCLEENGFRFRIRCILHCGRGRPRSQIGKREKEETEIVVRRDRGRPRPLPGRQRIPVSIPLRTEWRPGTAAVPGEPLLFTTFQLSMSTLALSDFSSPSAPFTRSHFSTFSISRFSTPFPSRAAGKTAFSRSWFYPVSFSSLLRSGSPPAARLPQSLAPVRVAPPQPLKLRSRVPL